MAQDGARHGHKCVVTKPGADWLETSGDEKRVVTLGSQSCSASDSLDVSVV